MSNQDVAVVIVPEPIYNKTTKQVAPVRRQSGNKVPEKGESARVAGWGATCVKGKTIIFLGKRRFSFFQADICWMKNRRNVIARQFFFSFPATTFISAAEQSYILNVTPNELWTQCLTERNVLDLSNATFKKFLRLNV